jgi:hypothetical protein
MSKKRVPRDARGKFKLHRRNARRRGITFAMTFEEWWQVWQSSGKWSARGRRRGQYCMARHSDRGSYEVGNVRICLFEENCAEQDISGARNPWFGRHHSIEVKAAISASSKETWRKPEFKAAKSAAASAQLKRQWQDPEFRAARIASMAQAAAVREKGRARS